MLFMLFLWGWGMLMKKVNSVFLKNKSLFTLFAVIITLAKIFGIISSQIIGKLFDSASNDDMNGFLRTIIYLIISTCIVILTRFLSNYSGNNYKKEVMVNIKTALFSSIIDKKIKDIRRSNLSEEFSSFINDMNIAENNYFYAIIETIILIINYFTIIAAFIFISPVVALVVALISVIPLLIPIAFKSELEKKTDIFIDHFQEFTSKIKEYLSGYEIIKGFSLENKIFQKYDDSGKELEKSKQRSESFSEFVNGSSFAASILVVAGTLITGMILALNGKMSFGQVIALTMVSGGITDAASGFGRNITSIRSAMPIISKFNEKLSNVHGAKNKKIESASNIKLQDLSVKIDGKVILKGINVEFKSTKKYALVGASGSGKSTLLNSILSYNDYVGDIYFDHSELREIDERSIFDIFSYVAQKPSIIDGTIRDNLNFYEDHSDRDLNDMLDILCLMDKIKSLENGMDTYIDENTLSGGEKQRINIGRALIRKKPFILLDEYTSALDNTTSLVIEKYILSLKDTCVISVTHRLNEDILTLYDEIILLDDGKILERGNFQDLINSRSYFYDLFNSSSVECDIIS